MEFFTWLNPFNMITVLWDRYGCVRGGVPHGVVTVAQEEKSVTLPVEAAFEVAAEMLMFLMDEDDVVNRDGMTLSEFLEEADEIELRRILSRISGPEGSTYTNP